MKKTLVLVMGLFVLASVLSSCGTRMFAKGYRSGYHATVHGQKAQARASRATKHFWF